MSLTLRDAQHLCWKTFRIINDKITPDKRKERTPSVTVADLTEDSGKVAGLVKALEEAKPSDKERKRKNWQQVSRIYFTLSSYWRKIMR